MRFTRMLRRRLFHRNLIERDPESGVEPPGLPWLLLQTWADLLFVHYRVSPEAVRSAVPPGMTLDTFRGSAYVSLVALNLKRIEIPGKLRFPGLRPFAQVNFRTYVRVGNQPGIYFFSIDAGSLLASSGARAGFLLPYHLGSVTHEKTADGFHFRSKRYIDDSQVDATWTPTGEAHPISTDFDRFLLLRDQYLARAPSGGFWRGAVRHPRWVVQHARAEVVTNLPAKLGLEVGPPICAHHAKTTTAQCWPVVPIW